MKSYGETEWAPRPADLERRARVPRPLRRLSVRGRARRAHALDRAHAPDGRLGEHAADRVPLARAGIRQDPGARGHRAAGAASGRGGERHAGLPVPQGGRRGGRADDPVRRDRHGLRAEGERTTRRSAACSTPATARRRRRPVRRARQDCRDRGDPGLLRRRAGRARRAARHDPDPLRHHPDAAPGAGRARRAVPAARSMRPKATRCATGWRHGQALSSKALAAAWPEMPDGIEDRDADVWEPLLAVADAAGGDWPERARVAAVALVALSKESTPSLGIRLLADLRDVFGDEGNATEFLHRNYSIFTRARRSAVGRYSRQTPRCQRPGASSEALRDRAEASPCR